MKEYNIIYKVEDEQLHNGERPFEEHKDTGNCYFHADSIEEAKEACLEYLVDTYNQKDGVEDAEEVDGTVEVTYASGRKEYFSCHEIMTRDEESGEDVSVWKM